MSFWFGYKALPDGKTFSDGPHDDVEKAMSAREKTRALHMQVSPWFSADDRMEADQIAKWHLDGAAHPNRLKH